MNSSDISFNLSIINHLGFGEPHTDGGFGLLCLVSVIYSLPKSQRLMKVVGGKHKAEVLCMDVCVLNVVDVCKHVLKNQVGFFNFGSHI